MKRNKRLLALVADGADQQLAESIRTELIDRGYRTDLESYDSARLRSGHTADSTAIVLTPKALKARARAIDVVNAVNDAGMQVVVVDRNDGSFASRLNRSPYANLNVAGLSWERLFEEVYRSIIKPMPPWLDIRVFPTATTAPTGVAWWGDELLVSDEKLAQVSRVGVGDSQVLLPGLHRPHHIFRDRNTLFVANTDAHEVLACLIDNGLLARVTSLSYPEFEFRKPHCATRNGKTLAIADSDNDRIIISQLRADGRKWDIVEHDFKHPCGVAFGGNLLWVADTFSHRIVALSESGHFFASFGQEGEGPAEFRYPVAVDCWNDLVFVADEGNSRLMMFQLRVRESRRHLVPIESAVASNWIRKPFGISINRERQLAVSDRRERCIWIIDLESLPSMELEDRTIHVGVRRLP